MSVDVFSESNKRPFKIQLSCLVTLLAANIILLSYQDIEFNALYLILVFFASLYYADFLSGITHSVIDYTQLRQGSDLDKLFFYEGPRSSVEYGEMRKKIMRNVGAFQQNVYDFKHHHLINSRTIVTKPAYNNFLLTLPLALPLCALSLLLLSFDLVSLYISLFFLLSGIIVFFAQYIHACAHGRKNTAVNFMQKIGLLLTKKKHATHHKEFEENFCFINGWADPVVNRVVRFLLRRGIYKKENLNPVKINN